MMQTEIRTTKIAPSILTADFANLGEQIQAAERGSADYIHLDVMDGTFVPNMSFGPMVINSIRASTSLPLDVHLMVQEPGRYVDAFANAGADIITVHVEACQHLHRTLEQIQNAGCRVGLALNPSTPIDAVSEVVYMLDLTLIMSVNPGFGGQRFIQHTLNKLTRMRALLDEFQPACELEVDGGVGMSNIREIVSAGANVLVAGSAVYNELAPVAENLAGLRQAMRVN